jgi:hypothetical protein
MPAASQTPCSHLQFAYRNWDVVSSSLGAVCVGVSNPDSFSVGASCKRLLASGIFRSGVEKRKVRAAISGMMRFSKPTS